MDVNTLIKNNLASEIGHLIISLHEAKALQAATQSQLEQAKKELAELLKPADEAQAKG